MYDDLVREVTKAAERQGAIVQNYSVNANSQGVLTIDMTVVLPTPIRSFNTTLQFGAAAPKTNRRGAVKATLAVRESRRAALSATLAATVASVAVAVAPCSGKSEEKDEITTK